MFKKIITILLIIGFLATLPAMYQNQKRVKQVEKELKEALNISEEICNSGCTDYPPDWVISGFETEAKLYCMRQCDNNMRGIRDELLEDFPILFTSQYNRRVAQLCCVIGLACPQLQITDFKVSYMFSLL